MTGDDPILVTHSGGRYPVHVAPGLLDDIPALIARYLPQRRIAVIADETVAALLGATLIRPAEEPDPSAAPPFRRSALLTFPPGEASKTREQWARLSDRLLEAGFGRDSGIVALGGGVTGDLAGFVAATYQRGVPYLQVPTTLLAMLDASVGGKTGVDTGHGKNLIGAFHQPVAVIADPLALRSLPERHYRAGLAEAVKHGVVADAEYFDWIEHHTTALCARDPEALASLIRRSVTIKAGVVGADEREAGRRAILNAGHTVAHAIEQVSGFSVLHGEAVALGLVAESRLAAGLGFAEAGLAARVESLLAALGLPVQLPVSLEDAHLIAAMRTDKKNRVGAVRFALPAAIGRMHPGDGWTVEVEPAAIAAALCASRG